MKRRGIGKAWLRSQPVEVQTAVARASEILRPYFAGESVDLYVPKTLGAKDLAQRRERILLALANGESPQAVAEREGLTVGAVRKMGARSSL